MKTLTFIKATILVLTLVAVIYAIRSLNSGAMGSFFYSLGIEPGTQQSPGLQPAGRRPVQMGEERLNICRTRVHALIFQSGQKIEELKEGLNLKWMAYDPKPREISYLDVEKWLSRHCQIVIGPRAIADGEVLKFEEYATIEFIDGSSLKVLKAADGTYRIEDRTFYSDDLTDALAELRQIALFEKLEFEEIH